MIVAILLRLVTYAIVAVAAVLAIKEHEFLYAGAFVGALIVILLIGAYQDGDNT